MKHGVKRRRRYGKAMTWQTALPTFLASVIVFGLAIVLPWLFYAVSTEEVAPADTVQGRQRSLLLLIHDAENELTAAVAVHTDTSAMTVTAVGYPSQTEVYRAARLSTLASAYADEGVAAVTYLSEKTGEHYDAVLRLSISAVAAFVATAGNGIRYALPEPVGVLPLGEQTLTSLQVADVLRYTGWQQSLTGRAEVHAGVTAAIINRYLTAEYDLEGLFGAFAEQCEDTVTISGFVAIRDELEQLARANDGTLCRAAVPTGRAVGSGAERRFVMI